MNFFWLLSKHLWWRSGAFRNHRQSMRLSLLVGVVIVVLPIHAKIRLQPMFSDNMVLQQQTNAPFWGEAKPGKAVTLVASWDGKKHTTIADANGHWKLMVATPKAGGPYSITISDGTKLKLNNVLVGEVWLCTGQSNMEMPMQGWNVKMNAEEIARSAKYSNIRLLQVDKTTSPKPVSDITVKGGGWMQCNPETVKDFSATGFFFGKNISESVDVPVGLIMTCWGGTVAEAWTSADALRPMKAFDSQLEPLEKMPADKVERQKQYNDALKAWNDRMAARVGSYDSKGHCVFAETSYDDSSWRDMTLPTQIEKAGLPGYDGYIWFRKTIDIPASWAGRKLDLRLSMIDDNDITYFNGVEIGRTEGYNVQRHYEIPARLVKAGKAVITVLDCDNGGEGGIWGEPKDMTIALSGSAKSKSLAGVWKVNPSTDFSKVEPKPVDSSSNPNVASVLFNAMINPLVPYAIRGAIWYQGEANVGRAEQYRDLLSVMIHDWRSKWGVDFPFYIMQLANFMDRHPEPVESDWAKLREAQDFVARNVAGAAMAVNIDIGNPKDIHPTTKDEVGRRLALLAEALTYGKNVAWSGPEYEGYEIEGKQIRLRFSHAEGMKAKDGLRLTGFAIAGPDHKFHWADARVDGSTVVVSAKEVECPLAVRYAWDDNPDCNLTNASGLPASPFRTDRW